MKKLALTTAALAVAFGAASPAFASERHNEQNIDTSIVSISGGNATLANGFTVEAPRAAAAGDKVRVVLSETNDLNRVFVLN